MERSEYEDIQRDLNKLIWKYKDKKYKSERDVDTFEEAIMKAKSVITNYLDE